MVLIRQDIEYPLNAGVNTQAGEATTDPSTASVVNNLRLNKTGEYTKTSTTATTTSPLGVLDSHTSIFAHNNSVCSLTAHQGILTLDPATDTTFTTIIRDTPVSYGADDTIRKYSPRYCQVSRQIINTAQDNSTNKGIFLGVSEISGDYLITAWITTAEGSLYRLNFKTTHLPTGNTVFNQQYVNYTSVTAPINLKVLPSNTGCTFFVSTGFAFPYTITAISYNIVTHLVTVHPSLTTNAKNGKFAVANTFVLSDSFYLAFTDNTTGFVKCQLRTLSTVTTTHNASVAAAIGIALQVGSATQTLIVWANSTTVYGDVFGTPTATTLMTTTAPYFGGVITGGTGTTAIVYAYETDTTPLYTETKYKSIDFSSTTPVAVSAQSVIPSCLPTVAPFIYDGDTYIGVSPAYTQGVPSHILIMRYTSSTSNGDTLLLHEPVARILHDRYNSRSVSLNQGYSTASIVDNKIYLTCLGDIQGNSSVLSVITNSSTLFLSTLDFTSKPIPYCSVFGSTTTLLASGLLLNWDGETLSEASSLAPPIVEIDVSAAGTETASTGFSAIAIYTWVDKAGNLHRSAPSTVKTSGAFTTQQIDVYVSKPIFQGFGSRGPKAECELYVTEDNGASYYRAALATTHLLAYPQDYSDSLWLFEDIEMGTSVFPVLYSTGVGGTEVVSEAPPAFSVIVSVADRIWGIVAEDPRQVWYTKPAVAGYAPEWSALQTIMLNEPVVTLAELQGNPVLFTRNNIWLIEGAGPDALLNGSFAPPRKMHNVSCIDPSVAVTPQGIIFRSLQGINILNTGFGLDFIGAPIEQSTKITDSTLSTYTPGKLLYDELTQEVRFIDRELSKHWIYSLRENKFTTKTSTAIDGVATTKGLYFLNTNDTITREYRLGENNYNRSTDSWSYTSNWISLSGLTGFNRVWEVIIQVKLPTSGMRNDSTLTATLSTRSALSGDAVETFNWTGAEIQTLGTDIVELRIKPSNQRMRALKLGLTETCAYTYNSVAPIVMRIIYGADKTSRANSTGSLKGNL